jgi:hypothetical protein
MDELNYITYEFDYEGEHYEIDDEGNFYGGSKVDEFNEAIKILARKYASVHSSPLPYFAKMYDVKLIEVEPEDSVDSLGRLAILN